MSDEDVCMYTYFRIIWVGKTIELVFEKHL